MSSASVKRVFASVKSVINLAIREHRLNCSNIFAGTFIPNDTASAKRLPIPEAVIRQIQAECRASWNWHSFKWRSTFHRPQAASVAAINKWLKPRVPEGCVIHSFRHSLRDRLRAVECPSDIVDAIGGWATSGIGQKYGTGYSLAIKNKWMKRIEVRCPITGLADTWLSILSVS